MVEIAVVGAGVAGLLLALNLRGRAVVFESGRPGLRGRRCAGIVSSATLSRLPEGCKFVEQEYDALELTVPELSLKVSIASREPFAYRIDRGAHEERLAELLRARGVEVRERTRVKRIEALRDGIRLEWDEDAQTYAAAVIAEGYPPILARHCSLAPHVKARVGVHAPSYAKGFSSSTIYVVYSPKLLAGFAWAAPVDEKRCSVGIVTGLRNASLAYRGAVALLRRVYGIEAEPASKLRGGYVLRGYPRALGRGRLFVFGDAAAMVKSLSGGGLYAISALASPLASVVSSVAEGSEPEGGSLAAIRKVLAALRRNFAMAERLDQAMAAAPKLGLKLEAEALRFEFDDHVLAIAQILAGVKKLGCATALR